MLNENDKLFFEQLDEPKVEYQIHFYDQRPKSPTYQQWFRTIIAGENLKHSYTDIRDAMKVMDEYNGKYAYMLRRVVAVHNTMTVVDWVDYRITKETI